MSAENSRRIEGVPRTQLWPTAAPKGKLQTRWIHTIVKHISCPLTLVGSQAMLAADLTRALPRLLPSWRRSRLTLRELFFKIWQGNVSLIALPHAIPPANMQMGSRSSRVQLTTPSK